MLNILYAVILAIATVLLKVIKIENIQTAIVLLAYLSSLFLLAMDSRSLNYIHYHPQKTKRKTVIIISFVLKIIGVFLFFLYYFCQSDWLFFEPLIISVMEIGLYFLVRKWLYSDITFNDTPIKEAESKQRRDIMLLYVSYLLTISLVFFPNYKNLISWFFIIPMIITITVWIKLIRRILVENNAGNKYLTYNILFFLSLIGFIFTKYVLGIESPISIPAVMSLLIMIPCFSRLSKFIKDKKDD